MTGRPYAGNWLLRSSSRCCRCCFCCRHTVGERCCCRRCCPAQYGSQPNNLFLCREVASLRPSLPHPGPWALCAGACRAVGECVARRAASCEQGCQYIGRIRQDRGHPVNLSFLFLRCDSGHQEAIQAHWQQSWSGASSPTESRPTAYAKRSTAFGRHVQRHSCLRRRRGRSSWWWRPPTAGSWRRRGTPHCLPKPHPPCSSAPRPPRQREPAACGADWHLSAGHGPHCPGGSALDKDRPAAQPLLPADAHGPRVCALGHHVPERLLHAAQVRARRRRAGAAAHAHSKGDGLTSCVCDACTNAPKLQYNPVRSPYNGGWQAPLSTKMPLHRPVGGRCCLHGFLVQGTRDSRAEGATCLGAQGPGVEGEQQPAALEPAASNGSPGALCNSSTLRRHSRPHRAAAQRQPAVGGGGAGPPQHAADHCACRLITAAPSPPL